MQIVKRASMNDNKISVEDMLVVDNMAADGYTGGKKKILKKISCHQANNAATNLAVTMAKGGSVSEERISSLAAETGVSMAKIDTNIKAQTANFKKFTKYAKEEKHKKKIEKADIEYRARSKSAVVAAQAQRKKRTYQSSGLNN